MIIVYFLWYEQKVCFSLGYAVHQLQGPQTARQETFTSVVKLNVYISGLFNEDLLHLPIAGPQEYEVDVSFYQIKWAVKRHYKLYWFQFIAIAVKPQQFHVLYCCINVFKARYISTLLSRETKLSISTNVMVEWWSYWMKARQSN